MASNTNMEKVYKNYLKMEGQYNRRNQEKMSASANAGGGLLSPRRSRSNTNQKTNDKKDPMQTVYEAVQAIRNRKI